MYSLEQSVALLEAYAGDTNQMKDGDALGIAAS